MRTMTGLSLKRPHVLYRSILFYLSIIGFVSISYSTVTIETTIFDKNLNGSISNVTGYFNTTNGIRITVTLTDDADGNHLTQFGNGKFSVWGCFTPGNQTPATDHGEFSDLNEEDDFLDGVATKHLSRNDITGNHSGTDNDVWVELTNLSLIHI